MFAQLEVSICLSQNKKVKIKYYTRKINIKQDDKNQFKNFLDLIDYLKLDHNHDIIYSSNKIIISINISI